MPRFRRIGIVESAPGVGWYQFLGLDCARWLAVEDIVDVAEGRPLRLALTCRLSPRARLLWCARRRLRPRIADADQAVAIGGSAADAGGDRSRVARLPASCPARRIWRYG